jgi:hypothetical protein
MKNIHVLPTEKPSRLMIDTIENKLYLQPILHEKTINVLTQNIYITSDEEIKEGQNYIGDGFSGKNKFKWHKSQLETYPNIKRDVIILTTDQDLIKDGVQAIDDNFLEWFVKNPSCESIECINTWMYYPKKWEYKIIIPKEEPKQHVEFINNNIDQFDKAIESFKQETLEEAKQEGYICPHTKLQCDDECCVSASDCHIKTTIGIISEPKQETLEEAKKYLSNEGYGKASNFTLNNVANLMLKWQQEQDKKIYSEEEVLDILFTMSVFNPTNITEWFEKFKRLNCKHKNIKREDGLDECLDCGVTNY